MKALVLLATFLFLQTARASDVMPRGVQLSEDHHGTLSLPWDISTAKLELSRKLQVTSNSNDANTAEEIVLRGCYAKLDRMTAERLVVKGPRLLAAVRTGTVTGECNKRYPSYQIRLQDYQAQVTGCTARCKVITLANGTTKSSCRSELTFTESPIEIPFTTYAEIYEGCGRPWDRG